MPAKNVDGVERTLQRSDWSSHGDASLTRAASLRSTPPALTGHSCARFPRIIFAPSTAGRTPTAALMDSCRPTDGRATPHLAPNFRSARSKGRRDENHISPLNPIPPRYRESFLSRYSCTENRPRRIVGATGQRPTPTTGLTARRTPLARLLAALRGDKHMVGRLPAGRAAGQGAITMRGRHFPRLCRSCDAPMARQGDSCWRCEAVWEDRSARPAARLVVRDGQAADPGGRDQSSASAGIGEGRAVAQARLARHRLAGEGGNRAAPGSRSAGAQMAAVR